MKKCKFNAALVACLLSAGVLMGGATRAWAAVFGGPVVTGIVAPEGASYRYSYTIDYTINNLSAAGVGSPVVGLTLPFFDDSSYISDIHSPTDWNSEFVAADASNWPYSSALDPNAGNYDAPGSAFDNPQYVLHWFNEPNFPTAQPAPIGVQPGQSLSGFNFLSPYGPGEGPVVLTLGFLVGSADVTLVDPPLPGTPNSPLAVPEPVTAGLGILALGGLVLSITRRRA